MELSSYSISGSVFHLTDAGVVLRTAQNWFSFLFYFVDGVGIAQSVDGVGVAQSVERRTRDRKVASSLACLSGGRIFFSRVNFLS